MTYATADTRPTPILTRIFFSPPSTIMETMRKQPQDFSLGQTASGGSQGMAALEGIVTAMEVRSCALLFFATPARVFRIGQVPPPGRLSYFQSFMDSICYDLTLIPLLIDV